MRGRTYEQTYPSAEGSIELERSIVLDLLRPYFLVRFRDLRFGQRPTPLNYDAVSTDTQFLNLVDSTASNRGVWHCFWHCWGSAEREDGHLRTMGVAVEWMSHKRCGPPAHRRDRRDGKAPMS